MAGSGENEIFRPTFRKWRPLFNTDKQFSRTRVDTIPFQLSNLNVEIICSFLSFSFFFFRQLNDKVYLDISKSAYVLFFLSFLFLFFFLFFRNQQSRAPAGDSPGRINKKRQVGAEETCARISSRPNFASRECFIEKFEGVTEFFDHLERDRESFFQRVLFSSPLENEREGRNERVSIHQPTYPPPPNSLLNFAKRSCGTQQCPGRNKGAEGILIRLSTYPEKIFIASRFGYSWRQSFPTGKKFGSPASRAGI